MRRIILILIVLVLIAAMVFGIGYFILQSRKTTPATTNSTTTTQTTGGLPTDTGELTVISPPDGGTGTSEGTPLTGSGQSGISVNPTVFIDDNVFDYWVNKKENKIYYLNVDGKLKNQEGNVVIDQAFVDLNYLKASSDGTRIILAFGRPQNTTFVMGDLITNTFSSLPNTLAVAWHPTKPDQFVYFDNKQTLNIADLTTKKITPLIIFNVTDVDLDWITADEVLIKERASSQFAASAWIYNIKTKLMSAFLNDVNGLMLQYLPEIGSMLRLSATLNGNAALDLLPYGKNLMATTSPLNNTQGIVSAVTLVSKNTLPGKCTVFLEKLFCAVFFQDHHLRPVSFMPDSYLRHETYTVDGLITLPDNSRLFTPSEREAYDMSHLIGYGKTLYFLNRYDNRVYKMDLE